MGQELTVDVIDIHGLEGAVLDVALDNVGINRGVNADDLGVTT